jgi:dihydrodipicolinate synthase/N-acetylneuraminate lyase
MKLHVTVYERFTAGDELGAREAFAALLPGVNYERLLHVPFVKGVLHRRGVVRSTATRMPAAPLDRHDWAELERLWPAWEPFFQPVAAARA